MNFNFKKGIILALGTAFFSGIANFVNKFAVEAVGDPLVHTTVKNSLVALLVISLLFFLRKLPKLHKLTKPDLVLLFAIGIIGGSLPFYLFFSALAEMSAVNAALIHKTLIFWVAILAVPLLGERISLTQAGALGLIFLSNLVIGGFKGFAFSRPELMVLAATVLWAIENVIAKIALRRVDTDIVVAARMGIGSVILLSATILSGKGSVLASLDAQQLGLVVLTSLILFGYVTTWYRALRVAPVTLVATVLTLATLITNSLSAVFVTHALSFNQFAQFVLIVAGLWFFLVAGRRSLQESEQIRMKFAT
jgi:drug/metabolite transporter (DMT)-like permease